MTPTPTPLQGQKTCHKLMVLYPKTKYRYRNIKSKNQKPIPESRTPQPKLNSLPAGNTPSPHIQKVKPGQTTLPNTIPLLATCTRTSARIEMSASRQLSGGVRHPVSQISTGIFQLFTVIIRQTASLLFRMHTLYFNLNRHSQEFTA